MHIFEAIIRVEQNGETKFHHKIVPAADAWKALDVFKTFGTLTSHIMVVGTSSFLQKDEDKDDYLPGLEFRVDLEEQELLCDTMMRKGSQHLTDADKNTIPMTPDQIAAREKLNAFSK